MLVGCHIPPAEAKGGTAPWLEIGWLAMPDDGLRPSAELWLGGVRRFPTLVRVVAVGAELMCGKLEVYLFCWRLGGGSSKGGKLEAFGLLEVKPVGAPIGSWPRTIEGGKATAAATIAVW